MVSGRRWASSARNRGRAPLLDIFINNAVSNAAAPFAAWAVSASLARWVNAQCLEDSSGYFLSEVSPDAKTPWSQDRGALYLH
jgi:hypothetical protein